ncbi:MAG: hypothetical protein PHQ76_04145 [Caldisericia bacterium]|nr:hypothetical protein [Caldisericia bacterium]
MNEKEWMKKVKQNLENEEIFKEMVLSFLMARKFLIHTCKDSWFCN